MTRAEVVLRAAERLERLVADAPTAVDSAIARTLNDPAPGSLLDSVFVLLPAAGPLAALLRAHALIMCDEDECTQCAAASSVAAAVLASDGPLGGAS